MQHFLYGLQSTGTAWRRFRSKVVTDDSGPELETFGAAMGVEPSVHIDGVSRSPGDFRQIRSTDLSFASVAHGIPDGQAVQVVHRGDVFGTASNNEARSTVN